jgi:hypothetical protein
MYIRRKVFSRFVDESGEEKLFSTTEFSYMTDEEQREFTKKNKKSHKDREDDDEDREEGRKKHKTSLSKYKSGRGIGRSVVLSGLPEGVGGGLAGAGIGAGSGILGGLKMKDDGSGIDLDEGTGKKAIKRGIVGGALGSAAGFVKGGAVPGLAGVSAGDYYATKADKEGKSDKEIVKASRRGGALGGAIGGAAKNIVGVTADLIRGARNRKNYNETTRKNYNEKYKDLGVEIPELKGPGAGEVASTLLKSAGLGASFGALGGMAGASKNTKARLKKRNKYEKEHNDED